MRVSPLVVVPLVAVAPLVGAAAISFPGVFGGPVVVLIVGYALVFAATVLPHRSNAMVAGWWLLAFAALVPPMLPAVAVPGMGVFWVPAFTGRVAWWVGAGLAVVWWVAWFRGPLRDAFTHDDVSEPGPENANETASSIARTVPDLTHVEAPLVGVPLVPGGRERTILADRYAGVVIADPDKAEDDEDEPSFLDQVADLFPDRRRSETGKVSIRDVVDRLGMTTSEVTDSLAQEGVPVARLNGVTPLAGGGSASAMNAVRWVDISRAAGDIPPRDRAEIGDHSNPRRQGT